MDHHSLEEEARFVSCRSDLFFWRVTLRLYKPGLLYIQKVIKINQNLHIWLARFITAWGISCNQIFLPCVRWIIFETEALMLCTTVHNDFQMTTQMTWFVNTHTIPSLLDWSAHRHKIYGNATTVSLPLKAHCIKHHCITSQPIKSTSACFMRLFPQVIFSLFHLFSKQNAANSFCQWQCTFINLNVDAEGLEF